MQSKFDEGYPFSLYGPHWRRWVASRPPLSPHRWSSWLCSSLHHSWAALVEHIIKFGLTMAVAVGISAINAPNAFAQLSAPCWWHLPKLLRMARKRRSPQRFNKAFNASFHTLVLRYKNGLKHLFKHRWIAWSLLGVTVIMLVVMMNTTKTGLILMKIWVPSGSMWALLLARYIGTDQ